MFRAIREQIDTIFRGDPAAKSAIEIIFCYPGFHAILLHRMAHRLYGAGFVLPAGYFRRSIGRRPESRFTPARKSAGGFLSTMAWAW